MTAFLAQGTAAAPDSLRAVLDTIFASPDYHWAKETSTAAQLFRWWLSVQRWLDQLKAGHPDLFRLLLWVLIAVLVVIFVHGAVVTVRTLRGAGAPPRVEATSAVELRGAAWYRREAQHLAGRGAYPEAMQADFLALILELDARQVVRFHPSKTPSEYTDEASLTGESRAALRALVGALYSYAFARQPCGPAEFAEWSRHAASDGYAASH